MRPAELTSRLQPLGLLVQGTVRHAGDTLLLIGNAGSAMWEAFRASGERGDGRPHPLDRWTRRVGEEIAGSCGAGVVFPFDGPPYPPFLEWAGRAGAVFPSPVSMYVHPRFGLWHAFRFALVIPSKIKAFDTLAAESPCLSCEGQPCLSACPVGAFDGNGYRVGDCVDYLLADDRSDCRTGGCRARHDCPVGREYAYAPEHAQFHMEAFLSAQAGREA